MKTGNTSSFQYFEEYISANQSAQGFRIGGQVLISRLIIIWPTTEKQELSILPVTSPAIHLAYYGSSGINS
jgi:hypothetical protein